MGAWAFPGNPYDGHTLAEQIEQTTTLLQDIGVTPTTAIVDLGSRGVDRVLVSVTVVHRGKCKTLTNAQRTWLHWRQAIEPEHRAHQGRSPHGPLLAQGQRGRRAAGRAVRGPASTSAAAAGHRRPRPQGPLLGLVVAARAAAVRHTAAHHHVADISITLAFAAIGASLKVISQADYVLIRRTILRRFS